MNPDAVTMKERQRMMENAKKYPLFGSEKCSTIEELASHYGRVISPAYEDRMRSYLSLPPAARE